jgi:phosphatidylglycerol---prolipoprotein diacylglyceryl transferase
VFDVLVNHPESLNENGPVVLLQLRHGISSFGGFLGAVIGLTIYFALVGKNWLTDADILVQGLVVGWIFGRLGCTIVHDHVGAPTSFFLGFRYPSGTHHDLGFYEFLATLVLILPAMLMLHRKRRQPGVYVVTACLLYAPIRFLLDFLRIGESRYWDLTSAQFCSIGLFAATLWLSGRVRSSQQRRGSPTLLESTVCSVSRESGKR